MQQGLIVNPKMKQPTRLERCVRTWMGAGAGTGVAVAARDADSASQSTTAMSESARSGARDLAMSA
jgi:hypothetical protein